MMRQTAVAAVLAAVLVGGCGSEEKPTTRPAPAAVHVTTAPVKRADLERIVEVVGTLYGDEEVVVAAKAPGRVEHVAVDLGDRIHDGAVLAVVEGADYQLQVRQRELAVAEALARVGLSAIPPSDFSVDQLPAVERARFQAGNAEARLDRARRLFQQDPPLISEQAFADLQTAWEVASRDYRLARLEAESQLALARVRQADLAVAQRRLADATIRAPGALLASATRPATAPVLHASPRFAVVERMVSAGEFVREGQPVFRLVADDPLKFRASVPARFTGDIELGQTVRIRLDESSIAAEGRVSRINAALDSVTRTLQIEVLVANPGRGAQRGLSPGAFARGDVIVGVSGDVLHVPTDAVVSFAGLHRVFSIREGKAVQHLVEPGRTLNGLVALPDLRASVSEVVVLNASRLANGVPVIVDGPASTPASRPVATKPAR